MALLNDLLPGLLPTIPDCPEPVALFWLREAAAEFCKETGIWRAPVAISAQAGQVAIPVPVPTGAALVAILSAKFNGYPLEAKLEADMEDEHPNWLDGVQGQPFCYSEGAANAITPYPTAAGNLVLRVALKPARDAIEIPAFLVDDWANAIRAGALAYLCRLPGKTWTDPGAASGYRAEFEAAIEDGRDSAQDGKHGARHRSKAAYF